MPRLLNTPSSLLFLLLGCSLALITFVTVTKVESKSETWPQQIVPATAQKKADAQKKIWAENPTDFRSWFAEYDTRASYLARASICKASAKTTADPDGVLLSNTKDGPRYNPVMLAQCGLSAHGFWAKSKSVEHLKIAVHYADKLIAIQDERGALPYDFHHLYYVTKQLMQPGWTSAMAQGQAMSLFSRLYYATGDKRYLDAGTLALSYLLTPVAKKGVMTDLSDFDPSLKDYVFFEEVVTEPNNNYILNGFMFALLGLYDWSQLPPEFDAKQAAAGKYFHEGVRTLEKILPYYEMEGMTVYDLTHFTFNNSKNLLVTASYTGVHVYLLHALHSITKSQKLQDFEQRWATYLDKVGTVKPID